jgi:hypothetical protein
MFGLHVNRDLALNLDIEGSLYTAVEVPADDTLRLRVYLTAPQTSTPATQEETDIRFWVEDLGNGERAHRDTVFNGTGG